MMWTSHVARRFGVRDWVEHAAVEVYNGLAERRGRKPQVQIQGVVA